MARTKILVAEDDPTIADVVCRYLVHDGHDVEQVDDGPTALNRALSGSPDLVVLDVMLPGMDGFEVCRRMRRSVTTPVVLLTALGAESDRITGLEIGADDYLTKPFSPRELTLRVQAVLRRARGSAGARQVGVQRDGDLTVDLGARQAVRDGTELVLTTREFDLLAFFLSNPGQVFSRKELLSSVWGWTVGDESTVTVHVRRLRAKLEADPADPQPGAHGVGVGLPLPGAGVDVIPAADVGVVALLTAGCTVVALAAGWSLLRLLRGRSVVSPPARREQRGAGHRHRRRPGHHPADVPVLARLAGGARGQRAGCGVRGRGRPACSADRCAAPARTLADAAVQVGDPAFDGVPGDADQRAAHRGGRPGQRPCPAGPRPRRRAKPPRPAGVSWSRA